MKKTIELVSQLIIDLSAQRQESSHIGVAVALLESTRDRLKLHLAETAGKPQLSATASAKGI